MVKQVINKGPLRNLMECIRNMGWVEYVTNMASGFELATHHHCSHASNFSLGKFLKNVKIVRIAKSMITFFLTVDCVSNDINEWHQVPKRKDFDFIFICPEVTVSILLWSMRCFLTSWCQELSDGILHEWLRSDNFQSLLYLKSILPAKVPKI